MGDRIKNLTNRLITIFKIEGNDAETIGKCWDIWHELAGQEYAIIEQSKAIDRRKIIRCMWTTAYKDLDWCKNFSIILCKTVNPKATFELPKNMCAGDPCCEFVSKIEE